MQVTHNKSKLRLEPGKRVYECSVCGELFTWNDESKWHGSLADIENKPDNVKYLCSNKCIEQFKK